MKCYNNKLYCTILRRGGSTSGHLRGSELVWEISASGNNVNAFIFSYFERQNLSLKDCAAINNTYYDDAEKNVFE